MIVVIVASDSEIKCLEKQISAEDRSVEKGVLFIEGVFANKKILLVKSGIGLKKARSAAHQILKKTTPSIVFSIGAAGAIDPLVKTGECVVLKEIQRVSGDLKKKEGRYCCDRDFSGRVYHCLKSVFAVKQGNGLTTGAFIHLKEVKEMLFSEYGAQVIDMESSVLADIFNTVKVPFVGLRIISDPADCNTIDMKALHQIKKRGKLSMISYFAKNPYELLRGLRLKREMDSVSKMMVRVLERIILQV